MGVAKMYGLDADAAYGTGSTGATVIGVMPANMYGSNANRGAKLIMSDGSLVDPNSITAKNIGGTGKSVGFNKSSGSVEGLSSIYLGKQLPSVTGGAPKAETPAPAGQPAGATTPQPQTITQQVEDMVGQINGYNPNGLLPQGFEAPTYASVMGNTQSGFESGKNLSGNLTDNIMNIYKGSGLDDSGDPLDDMLGVGKKTGAGKTLLGG
jgi:hypothetical protein